VSNIFNHKLIFIVRWQKATLLQTLVCRAGMQRFANVLFVAGFLYSCAGGEKTK
jgi:hypothetical protein